MNPTQDIKTRMLQLPMLADTFGPAFTFGQHALQALKRAGYPQQIDWDQVHRATIVESIEQHGQDPDDVHDALSRYSPGVTSEDAEAKLRGVIDELAPELSQRYDQATTKRDAEYAAMKAANGGWIKFIK